MKIEFKQVTPQHIDIISVIEYEKKTFFGTKKEKTSHVIGHIFSPAGTEQGTKNAIQVCGFDDAYDLWGCGIFRGTDIPVFDLNNNVIGRTIHGSKKDIQLLFSEDSHKRDTNDIEGLELTGIQQDCMRCFHSKPCGCEKEMRVKTSKQLKGKLESTRKK